jgi:hypothetical protein
MNSKDAHYRRNLPHIHLEGYHCEENSLNGK